MHLFLLSASTQVELPHCFLSSFWFNSMRSIFYMLQHYFIFSSEAKTKCVFFSFYIDYCNIIPINSSIYKRIRKNKKKKQERVWMTTKEYRAHSNLLALNRFLLRFFVLFCLYFIQYKQCALYAVFNWISRNPTLQ